MSKYRRMKPHAILITESDMERLSTLLELARNTYRLDREHLDMLEHELDRARVIADGEVPPDVVTMNSQIRFRDLDTGETRQYTLVFPRDADISKGRISVLAPIGTALLGYGVGDVIDWPVPGGRKRMRVEAVLPQPESSGGDLEPLSFRLSPRVPELVSTKEESQ